MMHEMIDRYDGLFKKYFGISMVNFTVKSALQRGWFVFDVLSFMRFLKKQYGYNLKQSLEKFLEARFGKEAVELIRAVILG